MDDLVITRRARRRMTRFDVLFRIVLGIVQEPALQRVPGSGFVLTEPGLRALRYPYAWVHGSRRREKGICQWRAACAYFGPDGLPLIARQSSLNSCGCTFDVPIPAGIIAEWSGIPADRAIGHLLSVVPSAQLGETGTAVYAEDCVRFADYLDTKIRRSAGGEKRSY